MAVDWEKISVRERKNTKRIRLRVTALRGVEVFVPKGFGRRRVRDFIRKNDEWLKQAIAQADKASQQLAPENICLQAIGEQWAVEYGEAAPDGRLIVKAREQRLLLGCSSEEIRTIAETLKRWLTDQARDHLVAWLRRLGEEFDLSFNKTTIRGQKTRWASCSVRGNISINRNLLFLPAQLVSYVLIHELCHTIRMDHSSDFWQLVEERVPDFRTLRQQIRNTSDHVPTWASPDA